MDSRLNLGEIPTLSDSAYQTVDSLNEVFVKGTTEPLNEKASESFLNAPEASKPLSYQDMMQLIPEKYRNAPGLPTANADGLHVDSTSSDENASKSSGQAEASYPEGFLDLLSEVLRVGPKVDSESQKRLEKEEDFSQGGNREVVKPIGVDFLEKEGEAFLKTHALNEFDFDPTPRGEWAKQILYDMKPFDNVIKSGEKVIPPSIYFSLKSPTEVELAKKLNSLTVENTLLNDFSGRSSTKLGGSRRASHPFSRPAVPLAEKGKATSQLLQFGVTPVEQNVVNQKAYDRTMKLTSLLDSDAPTEASAPVAPVAESPARISVPATEGVLDVGELRRNVPSLRSQVSSVSPRSQVSSAPVAPITPIAPVAQECPKGRPSCGRRFGAFRSAGRKRGELASSPERAFRCGRRARERRFATAASPYLASRNRPRGITGYSAQSCTARLRRWVAAAMAMTPSPPISPRGDSDQSSHPAPLHGP